MSDPADLRAYLDDLAARREKAWPKQAPGEIVFRRGAQTLPAYLRADAQARPDAVFLSYYGRDFTYAEIDRLSSAFAGALKSHGVRAGERVGLFMGNCPQFVICFLGILKLGAVISPINPMFKQVELEYQLKDGDVRAVVAQDTLCPLIREVRCACKLQLIFATGAADMAGEEADSPAPWPAGMARMTETPKGAHDLLAVLEAATPFEGDAGDLDAPAALNYTGGTTGFPKGCVHTQRDMLYTAAAMTGFVTPVGQDDVMLSFYPLFWIAGEDLGLLGPLHAGCRVVLLHRWDPVAWMACAAHHKASVAALLVDNAVEVMRHDRAPEFDLTSVRLAGVSSFVKKIGPDFRRDWAALTQGGVMRELAWGMTETNTCDTFTTWMQDGDYDLNQPPVFVGQPVPGTEFKICDFGTGALMPVGESGELCVRTPSLLTRYWNKESETAKSLRDGWLHTGDIGMINDRGEVHYLGRRKEMLKVKGMPVFPAEIEALLGRHPAVLGSGVVGRPDRDKGEVPVAFIRLDPDKAEGLDAEALRAWCGEMMAAFKVPEVHLVDQLPMTATGKVKKDELTALL